MGFQWGEGCGRMHEMETRSRNVMAAVMLLVLVVGVSMWLWGNEKPQELALGEWKDSTGRLRVEVEPGKATWRGAHRGSLRYVWVQADKSPYKLSLSYQGGEIEADLVFDGKNTAILMPDVWDKLPPAAQKELSNSNRRHGRPEREFRIIFRRQQEQHSSQ